MALLKVHAFDMTKALIHGAKQQTGTRTNAVQGHVQTMMQVWLLGPEVAWRVAALRNHLATTSIARQK